MNKLYFGDNLDVLRKEVGDHSIDLIYLDPPFNSQARYNVLFKSPRDDGASAQAAAFIDFWSWGKEAEDAYHKILTEIGGSAATFARALRAALGESDMMAYLVMMAIRLAELRRVLKPTGAIYLHCDPTASHYLKILLDAVFGVANFVNEITWKRTTTKSDFVQGAKNWPRIHDTLLYYARDSRRLALFNQPFSEYGEDYVNSKYSKTDLYGRKYMLDNLTAPGAGSRGHPQYEFLGVTRYWRYNKAKMERLHDEGLIVQPSPGAVPRYKRIGYPTQKPLALLERVIAASSNEGDTVLDPFCGCGTTVHAAESLGRKWIGIDVSIHAIHVIETRLRDTFGSATVPEAEGIPADYESAERLADRNPFQFQWWSNYLIGVHCLTEVKKGPDRGIDGELFFPNGPGRPYGRMLTSVKGGKQVTPAMVREFRGVLEREKAEMGLFICLDPPTSAMKTEALTAGYADIVHGRMWKLQIVSIADWFNNDRPDMPPLEQLPYAAFSAQRRKGTVKRIDPTAPELPLTFIGGKDEKPIARHFNPRLVKVVA